jgi:hypothetical protein
MLVFQRNTFAGKLLTMEYEVTVLRKEPNLKIEECISKPAQFILQSFGKINIFCEAIMSH